MLAIALGGVVYLLDTESGGSSSLCSTGSENTYISSVQWNKSGKYLAVGTSDAEVQVCILLIYLPTPYTPAVPYVKICSRSPHSCGM